MSQLNGDSDISGMACVSPIMVGNEIGPNGWIPPSMVRCGRCLGCRKMRKSAWIGRNALELLNHSAARFITLTYAENPTFLPPDDITLFLKRYRQKHGPFRYFAVGEYGEKSMRPHWHAIIYGHAQEFQGHWPNPCWKHGYSYDGSATLSSIAYVAAYTLKNTDPNMRTITRMSLKPGIGFVSLTQMARECAAAHTGIRIESWPRRYALGSKTYALAEGGLEHFKREYINAGGLPPVEPTPDERHILTLDYLAELGTRIEQERRFNAEWMIRRQRGNGATLKEKI